jgi:hypothetical protein
MASDSCKSTVCFVGWLRKLPQQLQLAPTPLPNDLFTRRCQMICDERAETAF